jgi:hypothetical protein
VATGDATPGGRAIPKDLPLELLRAEKSELAVLFTPRSRRADYGVALTRALMLRLKDEVERRGGRFVVFSTALRPAVPYDTVAEAGGFRYRLSSRQLWASLDEIHAGIDFLEVPVTVTDSREKDGKHLNARGNQQVMNDLARLLVEGGRLPR